MSCTRRKTLSVCQHPEFRVDKENYAQPSGVFVGQKLVVLAQEGKLPFLQSMQQGASRFEMVKFSLGYPADSHLLISSSHQACLEEASLCMVHRHARAEACASRCLGSLSFGMLIC